MRRLAPNGKSFLHSRIYRRACLFACLFPVVIGIACWIDGTWRMQDSGKGFSQHYGFWAIFLTTPIIFLLTSRLVDSFLNHIRKVDNYCVDLTEEMRGRVDKLVRRHVRSLSLRSRSAWILGFIMLVLLFWWLRKLSTRRDVSRKIMGVV